MPAKNLRRKSTFRVVDALDAPLRGRILRLRLQDGEAPATRDLKGARLLARSPRGHQATLRVLGFSLIGGKPSDARLMRTGRVDLLVESEGEESGPPVSLHWEVEGPL